VTPQNAAAGLSCHLSFSIRLIKCLLGSEGDCRVAVTT
jgi:hypothetical protein